MQIHELNTYDGTPDGSTYLALDDGSETSKVPATDIYPAMTQSQITSGVNTVKRVLTAAVLKPAIIAVAKTITDKWVDMTTPKINLDTSAASGDDYNLTQALTSLGWLSDVVTSGVLGGKKLLFKMLSFLNGDGAWQTLTSECKYFKKSGIVTIIYYSSSRTINQTYQTVATLPVGYRPASDMYFSVMTVTGIDQVIGAIQSNGNIMLRTSNGSTTYSGFTVSFPTVE